MSFDIAAALEALSSAELNRVRLGLWRKFGQQLQSIPDAPTPDDLLHEAIEDLLADRRHCPLERVELTTCLLNIVRSKVSHLYDKWKRDGIVKVPEEILDRLPIDTEEHSGLRNVILAIVTDDPLLRRIVEFRLDFPEAKARDIARALNLDMQEMYKANRRLKAQLRHLMASTPPNGPQGGTEHVGKSR